MKKLLATTAACSLGLLLCGAANAASSKVTADFSAVNLIDQTESTQSWDRVLTSAIHTASQSDLNVDASLECGLLTRTLVVSKNGKEDISSAEGSVKVRVIVDGTFEDQNGDGVLEYMEGTGVEAKPGAVTFCRRSQDLSATFQGLIDGCLTADLTTGAVTVDEECLMPEELELVLDTMSANSFNFVIPDLAAGDHDVSVIAEIKTSTEVIDGEAEGYALLGKGSVAVEEVRYVKDAF